jgi:starch synthase
MKIAVVASEAVPFAKTGGLADVCGALPPALEECGAQAILVLPKYQAVRFAGVALKKIDDDFDVGSFRSGTKVYVVKHDMYQREGLYGDRFGDYPDNLKRFSYFSQKVFELFPRIGFRPDIIHCHDWQTSLVPVYLRAFSDRFFEREAAPKSVLTIHNIAYQGIFGKDGLPSTGLGPEYFTVSTLEYYDKINLLKGGILFSDFINTVSPTYAREVLATTSGCGLEGVLSTRRDKFEGILNGIDYRIWNPQGDQHLFANYSVKDPSPKKVNKAQLQQMCQLTVKDDALLVGFVGRLVAQKGTELILKVLPRLFEAGGQAVILGTGDADTEMALAEMAKKHPDRLYVSAHFDDILAHRIYAGADVFLMPSQFEPCGIGQMISFKYGTVPVVFKTGGLADTVEDYNARPGHGNGFVFGLYDETQLWDALQRAWAVYRDRKKWQELMKRVMGLNFSWKESAKKYMDLYRKALRS